MNKTRFEILSQEIDDEIGFYRLRCDDRVYYLEIKGDVYDEDTMSRPYLLIPALPKMPEGDWVTMRIHRDGAGELQYETDSEQLPAMSTPEQKKIVDLLSLEIVRDHMGSRIKEVLYEGRPAIAKIVCWPWYIPYMSNEAHGYQKVSKCRRPNEEPLVPEVLAYITENGRPMGLLLEKLEGEIPTPEDLPSCRLALERLHETGMIHGDVNKYNMLIDRETNTVRMIDLEHSEVWEKETAHLELESLPQQLSSESKAGYYPSR